MDFEKIWLLTEKWTNRQTNRTEFVGLVGTVVDENDIQMVNKQLTIACYNRATTRAKAGLYFVSEVTKLFRNWKNVFLGDTFFNIKIYMQYLIKHRGCKMVHFLVQNSWTIPPFIFWVSCHHRYANIIFVIWMYH